MPKGYWMALVTIKNPERYKDYIAANGTAFAKYEAKFVVRGGKAETMAGPRRDRHVVMSSRVCRRRWIATIRRNIRRRRKSSTKRRRRT